MVRHLSLLFCKIIEHVNHGQSPAVTGDQPVHELGNQAFHVSTAIHVSTGV